MGEALKPCPFCGGEASSTGRSTYSDNHEAWWADGSRVLEAFFVNCITCGITNRSIIGGYQTREDAVRRWNTRATKEAGDDA